MLLSYLSLDREWFRDVQLDNLKLSDHDVGCEPLYFELQLNDEEKEKLKTWLKSFNEGHVDINDYAPSVLLTGKTFQINIFKTGIVFSYQKGRYWKQFSRPGTSADQEIRSWLRKISQLKGKPIYYGGVHVRCPQHSRAAEKL